MSIWRSHIQGSAELTAQVKRGYEILWHALTQKPRDEVISEMINNTKRNDGYDPREPVLQGHTQFRLPLGTPLGGS